MSYWYYKSEPIHVEDGYRAKTRRGRFGKYWYSQLWINNIENSSDRARMTRARSYLRKGQVTDINIKLGMVEAEVQGSRVGTYSISIKFTRLNRTRIKNFINHIKKRPEVINKLIAGELAPELEDIFLDFGIIPRSLRNFRYSCSCPDYGRPCKHVGSILYVITEMMDDSPVLLFVMKGIDMQDILKELKVSSNTNKKSLSKVNSFFENELQDSNKMDYSGIIDQYHHYISSQLREADIHDLYLNILDKMLPAEWFGERRERMEQLNLSIKSIIAQHITINKGSLPKSNKLGKHLDFLLSHRNSKIGLSRIKTMHKDNIKLLNKHDIYTLEDIATLSSKKYISMVPDFSARLLEKFKQEAIKILNEEDMIKSDLRPVTKNHMREGSLIELRGVGEKKVEKLEKIGILSIHDLAITSVRDVPGISIASMGVLIDKARRYLRENNQSNTINCYIIHGFWVSLDDNNSPGLFIWIEEPARALSVNKKNKIVNDTKILNPDKLEKHPFVLTSDDILEMNSDDMDIIYFLRSMRAGKEIVNMYLPTTSDNIPLVSSSSKQLWLSENDKLRKITQHINAYMDIENDIFIGAWAVDGMQLDIESTLKLMDLIDNNSLSDFYIADDLRYWISVKNMLEKQVDLKNIIPSVVNQHRFVSIFSDKDVSKNNRYVGWWRIYPSESYIANYKTLSEKYPYSAIMKKLPIEKISRDELKAVSRVLPKVVRTDTVPDTVTISNDRLSYERCQSVESIFDKNIFDNFIQIMTNSIIRSRSMSNSKKIYKYSNSGEAKKIVNGLFSFNPIIKEESYWMINQYRDWLKKTEDEGWKLTFQLVPPSDEPDQQWLVTFILRNKSYPHVIIPCADIVNNPGKSVRNGNITIDNPMKIIMNEVNIISDIDPLIAKILYESELLYYTLSSDELDLLLGNLLVKLKKHNVDVLLPKSILRNFVPRENTKLQIEFNGNSSLGMNDIINYDLSLMIGDQNIDISEIEKLADDRKTLVKLAGKWVNFDFKMIKIIKRKLDKMINGMNNLDIIKMELGDHTILGIDGFNVVVKSDLQKLTQYNKHKVTYGKLANFNGKLREYQKKGVEWMINLACMGMGGCMADDMGLGKTIQALASIQYLVNKKYLSDPVLIVAPTSVLSNWVNECEKFTPKLKIFLHHGSDRIKNNKEFNKLFKKQNIIVTSYSLIRLDIKLFDRKWGGIIIDEAQNIKNPGTQQSKIISSLNSSFRFALTGTPIENRLSDLWSIYNFVLPNYLDSYSMFKENYINPIVLEGDELKLELLKKLIFPFIIRRSKKDRGIIKDLPEKLENDIHISLNKEQLAIYTATTKNAMETLKGIDGMKRRGLILSTLGKLKQICNHLGTFINDEKYLSMSSTKLDNLIMRIESIIETGEKAIIFTQYVSMGKIIQNELEKVIGYRPFFLHGATSRKNRVKMIDLFNNDLLSNHIIIVSIKAGGTGLNLIAASHVFHYDRWWNPAVEDQATDRAYRIGQKRNVFVYKYITKGTVEEKIDKIITQKRELADQFISGIPTQFTEMNDEQLSELFSCVFHGHNFNGAKFLFYSPL